MISGTHRRGRPRVVVGSTSARCQFINRSATMRRATGRRSMKSRYVRSSLALTLTVVVGGELTGCSGGEGNPDSSTGGAAGTVATGAAGRGGTTGMAGTGGTTPAGSAGVAGTSAGGAGQSGTQGSAGAAGGAGAAGSGAAGAGIAGGSGGGGRGGGAAGTSGAAGRGGAGGGGAGTGGGTGGSSARWTCPLGSFTAPTPSSIALTKVTGVPPFDSFNNNGNNFGNIEGAVWFGDALYVSEIASGPNPPSSRILRVSPTGSVSIAYATSGPNPGTNGLAIDEMGRLIAASHGVGGIVALNLTNMTSRPIVSTFAATPTSTPMRFNSPNDLTVRSDGTIYFTDPDF